MDIKVVLKLIEPYGAELVFGKKGINNNIVSVEVMEIPQVEEWIKQGTLIITTLYSVKDDTMSQIKLIQTLIDKKAGGLIIKLGRFVDQLPEEAIRLAEKNNLPIITLPSNVPYVKILTPLYKSLNASKDVLLTEKIEGKSYDSVIEILDEIFDHFGIVTYIENLQGELMFSGNYKINDEWRNTNLLLSTPSFIDTDSYIEKINKEYSIYKKHTFLKVDKLKRIIVPLFSKGEGYGLLHIVYKNQQQKDIVTQPIISKLIDKVHVSLMSELISLQNQRLNKNELFNKWKNEQTDNTYKVLLHVQLPVTFINIEETRFIDNRLLITSHLEKLVFPLDDLTKTFVFEKNNTFYMLLIFTNKRISSTTSIRVFLNNRLKQTVISHYLIAISTPFIRLSEIDEKLDYITKIIDVGKRLYPELQVFSFNKLGIYQILLNLSNMREVIDYVDSILGPLIEVDPILIDTLEMYLEMNGNASRTAERLYLNRRTVAYRLKKIRELCELDLDNAETVFILQFCLKIKELS